MNPRRGPAWMLAAALLAACQATAPRPAAPVSPAAELPAADFAALRREGATIYTVDAAASQLLIYAFRGGAAARLGHNHVLSAPALEGRVALAANGDPAGAHFELDLQLDTVVIDDPALREATGGHFAGARPESDIAGTRRNLLGPRGLDAATHPQLRVRSLAVAGDWPMMVARVAIHLHGVTRERELLLQVERPDASTLRARGEFVARQSEFGLTPLSILGGAIAVQDPVAIRFDLLARRQDD